MNNIQFIVFFVKHTLFVKKTPTIVDALYLDEHFSFRCDMHRT